MRAAAQPDGERFQGLARQVPAARDVARPGWRRRQAEERQFSTPGEMPRIRSISSVESG